MTEEIEAALAQAIEREHAARMVGAADQQAQAMGEIRALRAAERQRRFRERIREGRTVYRVELPAVDVEELLASFGAGSLGELIEGLIEIDRAVTHNGARLADLIQCALENNPHEV